MNILLKELRFSNMFSYGPDNVIDLTDNNILQLSAENGSGKTSLILILQELLYSKNIKGIKKTDILNRYSKDKSWSGEVDFSVDDKQYCVSVKRTGASTKVSLLEDGIDISEHKVIDTYKRIQEILGIDFSVFSQLTYQSSTDLLQFLKATDTNRKKFLINLFNLEKYIDIGERVKKEYSLADKEVTKTITELNTVTSFLENTSIPEYKTEKPEVVVNDQLAVEIADIQQQLASYNNTCKIIDRNNMYIKEKSSLKFDLAITAPEPLSFLDEYEQLKVEINSIKQEISKLQASTRNLKLNDTCPSCGQPIDNSHQLRIKQDAEAQVQQLEESKAQKLKIATEYSNQIKEQLVKQTAFDNNQKQIERFEHLTQLIDDTIPTEYPDVGSLRKQEQDAKKEYTQQQQDAKSVIDYNKQVSAHNSKVDALLEQKQEFIIRQKALESAKVEKSNKVDNLNILKKAFSTTGIVAFKLENLTKELEVAINYYLSLLSDGQFQLEFLLDKEKLNISVINNGKTAAIETVSGGEFSRIQTAVLLAIRSLLSKLGGSSINLLFLDEVMGVLDDAGKESLITLLLEEKNLNVFLVSHEYEHPLVPKLAIIKNNNISCLEK